MQSIIAFPQDHQTWRIDWFGDVRYIRQYRYNQPFIQVALSRASLDSAGEWHYPDRFGSQLDEQVHAVVPIGMLGMLTIGSIWQDGRHVTTPDYTLETFTVTGHHTVTPLVKAGTESTDGSFMLPFDVHPYHRAHTHSYCVQATLEDGTRLIVPAAEMIRFYFGSSSGLLGRLFQGPFQEKRLWSRAEIDGHDHALIELARGVSGWSATDVARIALDPCALHAAKMISSSLLSVTDSNNRAYPKMPFPFVGKSDLRVRGIWLGEGDPRTFLAFQILSCSHRFPFKKLSYLMKKKQADAGGDGMSADEKATRRKGQNNNGDALVSDAPDSRKTVRENRYRSESRFPDLDRKKVSRVDPVTPVSVVITESGEIAAGSSIGDGEGKTGVRPIDLVAAEDAPLPKGHPLEGSEFAKYVDEVVRRLLKQRKKVWFVPLDARQRYPQFSVMPEIVREDGEIHPLSHIKVEGKARPRYVSILREQGAWPMGAKAWLIPEAAQRVADHAEKYLLMSISVDNDEEVNCGWVARQILQHGTGWR